MCYEWRILLVCLIAFVQSLSIERDTSTRREWMRKTFLASSVAAGTLQPSGAAAASKPHLTAEYYQSADVAPSAGRSYFPTLTPPFQNRATYRYNLGRNAWAVEQLLTFANVTATIRCNVIKLEAGGLWVHSPQWPTGEFLQLLSTLNETVKHIVLPCNALEHKAPMQAFTKRFPQATVWISPGQYGFFGSCGMTMDHVSMPYRVDGIFSENSNPPWADEFDIATLYVDLPQNAGPVSEVAFLHRPSKTLIATDAVVYIPQGKAPEIFSTYFDKNTIDDSTFWARSVLQAVFLPLRTDENAQGYPGYQALEERLVRAPILRAFADARAPTAVREWTGKIAAWDFDRILTSHFASPISATPLDFYAAYSYLLQDQDEKTVKLQNKLPSIACMDWELLEGLNKFIAENNLGAPTVFDYTVGCE